MKIKKIISGYLDGATFAISQNYAHHLGERLKVLLDTVFFIMNDHYHNFKPYYLIKVGKNYADIGNVMAIFEENLLGRTKFEFWLRLSMISYSCSVTRKRNQ